MEINWVNPPERKNSNKKEFVNELKANPGVWALWKSSTYASQAYIFKKNFENIEVRSATNGKTDKGTSLFDIYIRYVPAAEEAQSI